MNKLLLTAENDKRKQLVLMLSAMLISAVLLFAGKTVFAFTVNVSSGTFADFYTTFMGFVYGVPGIVIGIIMLLFGVIMMLAKHFLVFVIALLAVVLFFLSPEIVLGLAKMGAGLAGAMI